MIFYDQKTCHDYACEKSYPSMRELVSELEEKTTGLRDYGLIAHSWGGLLALEFIKQTKHLPQEVIFINPVPLKDDRAMIASAQLFSRVESVDRKFFEPASDEDRCLQNLPKVFQYYNFDQEEHPYSGKQCNFNLSPRLFSEIGAFDYVSTLKRLPKDSMDPRSERHFFT